MSSPGWRRPGTGARGPRPSWSSSTRVTTLPGWSRASMARRSGLSDSTIGRIWRRFELRPHLTDGFKLSTDPLFVEKVIDVAGLYHNPPERAVVLYVDEKSQVQAYPVPAGAAQPRPMHNSRQPLRSGPDDHHGRRWPGSRSADLRGNLVAQTAGSRRRTGCSASGHPAAQRPCQRFGSADERAHSPRRAWRSLHRAISGCGDPVGHEDPASRPAQAALPRVPGSGRCADPVVRPPPRQVRL